MVLLARRRLPNPRRRISRRITSLRRHDSVGIDVSPEGWDLDMIDTRTCSTTAAIATCCTPATDTVAPGSASRFSSGDDSSGDRAVARWHRASCPGHRAGSWRRVNGLYRRGALRRRDHRRRDGLFTPGIARPRSRRRNAVAQLCAPVGRLSRLSGRACRHRLFAHQPAASNRLGLRD